MTSVILENVGVTYRVHGVKVGANSLGKATTGGEIMHGEKGSTHVHALQGITFSVSEGDRVGFVGHNGAGKSTLLKVVSGLLPPTSGSIIIDGQTVPLLSLSLGLDNHSSGRQNIFLRAQLMGIHKEVVQERLNAIEDFSDLGEYLDLPLKTYSSGMRMRLAFAIATSFKPDILVMDEWLSAGDERFKKRAADRMTNLVDSASILFIASHSRNLIRRVCNKVLVMRSGKSLYFGDVEDAFDVLDNPTYVPGESKEQREVRIENDFQTRMSDLTIIKSAIEAYNKEIGQYPNTDSAWVGKGHDDPSQWIKELVPLFLDKVPQDPLYNPANQQMRYLYRSDGTDYKLVSLNPPDLDRLNISHEVKVDPARANWAYGYWTKKFENL